jgi:hypothetical protein
MTRQKNPNAGFTIIEIVLVVTLLAAIGAAVFFALRTNSKSTPSGKITSSSLPAKTTPSPSPTATSTADDSKAGYITIKEYGVKFKLPSELSDLRYAVASDGSVNFSTKALESRSDITCNSTDADNSASVAGIFYKSSDKNFSVAPDQPISQGSSMKQVNGIYYDLEPSMACGFSTPASKAEQARIHKLLAAAIVSTLTMN